MASDSKKGNKKSWMPALLFLFVFTLLAVLYLLIQQKSIQQKKEQYAYIATNETNIIKDCFDTVVARAFTINALIISDSGSTEAFQDAAERCYKEIQMYCGLNLKNIAIAPGGIVEQVYPLENNEALIGFNFMDETQAGNLEAIEAYQNGEMVVTNPFQLVQGGSGMGARLPVFLSKDGERVFWGLVTITLDFDELMDALDLDALTQMGVCYELWFEGDDASHITLRESEALPTDPVTKPFSLMNLKWNITVAPEDGWASVGVYIAAFAVITALASLTALLAMDKVRIKEANEKLTQLAYFDALTLCHSRQYVNTVLINQRTGEWNSPEVKYSLALVDVDYFKAINDTYGHALGDRTLAAITQLLEGHTKPEDGDCVIRHGGDEFVLLFHDVTLERFEEKLKDIVEGVHNLTFSDFPDLHLSISVGGAFYSASQDTHYYAMVKRADEKLYQSKENGRNQYTL